MKNRNLDHKDDWATPEYIYIYDPLDKEFDFTFDPCPLGHDITQWNGLDIEWGERNFVNPPYSRKLKEAFVKKAIYEARKGKLCVCLLPVSTSTNLFHDHILPNVTEKIRFVRKRIKFKDRNSFGEYVTDKAQMHDSMFCIFDYRNNKPQTFFHKSYEEYQLISNLLETNEYSSVSTLFEVESYYDNLFTNRYFSAFRATKYDLGNNNCTDIIKSKEEFDKWILDNKESVYDLNLTLVNEFWENHKGGCITFTCDK